MKRRSHRESGRIRGSYAAKMESGHFMYGGYINKNNDSHYITGERKNPRRCVAKL